MLITVKFDLSTGRMGLIRFARLFEYTKHNILLAYLLTPHLLSCMRDVKCNKECAFCKDGNEILGSMEKDLQCDEFCHRRDSNSVSHRS